MLLAAACLPKVMRTNAPAKIAVAVVHNKLKEKVRVDCQGAAGPHSRVRATNLCGAGAAKSEAGSLCAHSRACSPDPCPLAPARLERSPKTWSIWRASARAGLNGCGDMEEGARYVQAAPLATSRSAIAPRPIPPPHAHTNQARAFGRSAPGLSAMAAARHGSLRGLCRALCCRVPCRPSKRSLASDATCVQCTRRERARQVELLPVGRRGIW